MLVKQSLKPYIFVFKFGPQNNVHPQSDKRANMRIGSKFIKVTKWWGKKLNEREGAPD